MTGAGQGSGAAGGRGASGVAIDPIVAAMGVARETVLHAPRTLAEALEVKATHGAACMAVAGGTDLMVGARPGVQRWDRVLDLWGVAELRGISTAADGALVIGASTTFAEIIRSQAVREAVPALADAARTIGAEQIQARATIGGNVVNASPAADSVPVLSVCDARFVLASAGRGERVVGIHEFYRGYKKLALEPDELLIKVILDARPWSWMAFRKVGTRAAQSIAKVAVAGRAHVAGGEVKAIALAFASVGPTVVRARAAEAVILGKSVTAIPEAEVVEALGADVRPIDDVRSTADYRRRVAANVTRRLLRQLAAAER